MVFLGTSKLGVIHQGGAKLNQLDDVGEVEEGTFSVEKVLSLKPDLLVLADWQYEMLGSDLDAINEAGIPIVVLDYNAQTLDKHIKSTENYWRINRSERSCRKKLRKNTKTL